MYGIIIDSFERFIISSYGEGFWFDIATEANIPAGNLSGQTQWVINEKYSDEIILRLNEAASKKLHLPAEDMIESFGYFFLDYTRFVLIKLVFVCTSLKSAIQINTDARAMGTCFDVKEIIYANG